MKPLFWRLPLVVALCAAFGAAAAADLPAPHNGERLSTWLLRTVGPNMGGQLLHWQVPAEQPAQLQLKNAARQGLPPALGSWLAGLPVTGRVPLLHTDPRWLEVSPVNDPVLSADHKLQVLSRPRYVAVLLGNGPGERGVQPCLVEHRPGATAQQYLQACGGAEAASTVDHVWVAQPDGSVADFGIQPWNVAETAEVGVGAWVWAPSRNAGVSSNTSSNLARFLATQLPYEQQAPQSVAGAVFLPQQAVPAASNGQNRVTSNDWGEAGYLQTPSARMSGAGSIRTQLSRVWPYTRFTVMLQPLDWLEGGFRYTSVANRLYGPIIAGDQSYKDKSIDIKLRLKSESAHTPELALGLRDLGGTGLFASEYLVASKRLGGLDASLGLGWGNMGARGNVRNPFSVLFGSGFNQRVGNTVGTGGTLNVNDLFHGPTALFGGVQWQPQGSAWTFKAELDGNHYQNEPQNNNQPVRTPFNFGAVYRYGSAADLSFGLERGNRAMVGLTLHGQLDDIFTPKVMDVAPPAPNPQRSTEDNVFSAIEHVSGWQVQGSSLASTRWAIHIETDGALYMQQRLDRVLAVLQARVPATVRHFDLTLYERGLPLTQVAVDRSAWVQQQTVALPPSAQVSAVQYGAAGALTNGSALRSGGSWFEWSPSYSQSLGGPDGFLLYQLGLQASAEHRFTPNTWLVGNVNARLLDNYDKFVYDGPGNDVLPRVRTKVREYVTTSRITVPNLQLTHVGQAAPGHYYSLYGGLLESMYGGVGAEWLFRPYRSPWAVGVDANAVRQRGFRQDFAFQDYTAATGHATLYWDTGWNDVHAKVMVGKYLAGDVGATLDVKRTFKNGVAIGAWATKTNVSAADFGEGSFDKGIYVTVPFDAMLPISTPGVANIIWNPLTRDGGARLNRKYPLFDLTQQTSPRAWQWRSAEAKKPRNAFNNQYVLQDDPPHPLSDSWQTTQTLGKQVGGLDGRAWWFMGSAVLASSLLDKPADRWAQQHSSGAWAQAGDLANASTYALVAGAGLAAMGLGGQQAATTAGTAWRAAAYTLGTNMALRYVVGRARPAEGQGSTAFNGFNTAAFKSGFASNHTALAFALATPFAQQHNMPWLYGVAAAGALGRVQKREHWVSDTVAGGLLGYGMATLLGQQQQQGKAPVVALSPGSVTASWRY
jgi:membrane-associated phospholipid phosphatase